jgi:hypothetical protein
MAKRISQMELMSSIVLHLDSVGVKEIEPRQYNAIISAANSIIAEFERDPVTAKAGMGLAAWRASDDTGLSSKYMACVLNGDGPGCENNRPWDPSDLGRCIRLLEACPELRPNLDRLKDSGPVWKAFVEHWDELESLYREESPTGSAPMTYSLMQQLAK